MTTANSPPAAPIKRSRSLTQGIDHRIAASMRERRTMLGLTLQQVAEMLGVTYQQLYKYEKGVNRISAGRLHALARALGVDVGYFYEGLGSGEPARPTAQQQQTIELARSFAVLPRRQQEALAEIVRALAGAGEGEEPAARAPLTPPPPRFAIMRVRQQSRRGAIRAKPQLRLEPSLVPAR